MGQYLYCFGSPDHPPPPPDVTGIDGAPVRGREVGGLSAWVSDAEAAPSPTLERVREHNRVVERACDERTALPLRFGQWFAADDALHESVLGRMDELRRGLQRVAGTLEMGIRVFDPDHEEDDAPPDRSTGRAYLEGLARREGTAKAARSRGEQVARELGTALNGLVREARIRPLGSAAGLVVVAHLVARHDIGNYQVAVGDFAAGHKALRFQVTGPWPPYGFADDERDESA